MSRTRSTTRAARSARADPGQRGAAMLLIATLLVALLAGGGVALYLQLQGTRGAGMVAAARRSLYCAEAGLAASRETLALNYLSWPVLLDGDPSNDPSWYPLTGDIDGQAGDDYRVTIRDNDDELPPAASDPARDNDRQVFLVSTCIADPGTSRQVVELLLVAGGGHAYRSQAGGGAFNAGNQNR